MIIDGGARGHALALAYLNSGADQVLVAPGNEGMEGDFINTNSSRGKEIYVDERVSLTDPNSILKAAKRWRPTFVDVAQDDAIERGTVNLLEKEGFATFGATREAGQLEWDKKWSRNFVKRHNLPGPECESFKIGNFHEATNYADGLLEKYDTVFFKAAGLYAGKGVVAADKKTSLDAIEAMKGMGKASKIFMIEEGMEGEEFSYYAIVDGKNFLTFESSQDNKRIRNRDQGPNTGGMGCNSPALVTSGLESRIIEEIIGPTVEGMAEEGRPYKGILYLGGMVCDDGSIKIVEYNSRWGDPENHVILPKVSGYLDLVKSAINGKLSDEIHTRDSKTRVCTIGASAGYPGPYDKGKEIIIDRDAMPDGVHLLSSSNMESLRHVEAIFENINWPIVWKGNIDGSYVIHFKGPDERVHDFFCTSESLRK